MVDYVKGSEIDDWHWCKNCTLYPAYIHVRLTNPGRRPRSHLCSQCKEKEGKEVEQLSSDSFFDVPDIVRFRARYKTMNEV
jgi:protein-arginine kinase activator protein McsA